MHKDFFISYTSKDKVYAEWIAWQLEAEGYSTIIQAWDFIPGNNFVLEMDKATRIANKTIIVLSKNFVKSGFTAAEWAAAFAQDPTGEDRKLIPVKIDNVKPEGLLKAIIYIDISEMTDETEGRNTLLQGVADGRRKPSSAPAFPSSSSTPTPTHPTSPSTTTLSPSTKKRIHTLTSHLEKDHKLLADYEDDLRYEDDQRRKAKIEREIARQRVSIEKYQDEYNQLTENQPITQGDYRREFSQMLITIHALLNRLEQ